MKEDTARQLGAPSGISFEPKAEGPGLGANGLNLNLNQKETIKNM